MADRRRQPEAEITISLKQLQPANNPGINNQQPTAVKTTSTTTKQSRQQPTTTTLASKTNNSKNYISNKNNI